ncbi:ribosome maturation factor RimM [Neomoorella mulderi]|uniref:Ribosome maturation factor RimM n=1 Tax=Moorella mulderi DSM 14980 TaxID=1122241 RepID=A0A151AWN8_9FIRM|nr:ribosome maturation factor RimM [Moorella mulderi]KYH32074.1 ribosome maturation factor RimM [Moorella mulderi DSM 14980]
MGLDRIGVGKIVATHGVRGEVKVEPWTDFLGRFRPGTRLILQRGEEIRPVTVARARPHGRHLILKLAEINDADQAGALRGALLKVEPWEVEPLPEGHYYIFQLVGSRVYTTGGDFLGTLTDVLTTGANDVYVVKGAGKKEILIPALKEVVRKIDLARREISVALPPGLLD